MDRAADILRVAEGLYAAAAAPASWSPALEAVVALVRGDHAILVGPSNAGPPFIASFGIDDGDLAHFFSAEGMRLMAPVFTMVPDGVTARTAFISDTDFTRTVAYNDLIRPMKGFYGIHVRQHGGLIVNICRPQHADDFDEADVSTMQRLVPHLATALELQRRLRAAEDGHAGLARTLDRLDTGVIIADGSARPVMLNRKAERIVADTDGLALDLTGLAAATPAATRQLRGAIAAAGRDDAIEAQRLRLARPSRRLPLLITVLPIWRLSATVPGAGGARVALFITEPDDLPLIDRSSVTEMFHLTPREAEIALLLAGGLDRAAIAQRLGLAAGTVREHLRHVFEKTGARSQLALATLLRGFADRLS